MVTRSECTSWSDYFSWAGYSRERLGFGTHPALAAVCTIGLSLACLAGDSAADTTYEYDALGRLTVVRYEAGTPAEHGVTYEYDAGGNILTVTRVPEPGAALGLASGAALLWGLSRRRDRRPRKRHAPLARRAPGSSLLLPLAAIAFVWAPASTNAQSHPPTQGASGANTAQFRRPISFGEIQQVVAASEYEVSWARSPRTNTEEAWQAPNRAQGFRTVFEDRGIRVFPRSNANTDWELTLELVGYGRADMAVAPIESHPRPEEGNRVGYNRGPLDEWYINTEAGLEQGFTLHVRPRDVPRGPNDDPVPGRRAAKGLGAAEPAYLTMKLGGGMLPELSADRQAVDLKRAGSLFSVAHIGKLHVIDAGGEVLTSWFELFEEDGAQGIRIVFDDEGAQYPVTVDPLLTSPSWSVEGNQTGADLGRAVAMAGDVNGDGFDDVLVAAPDYDKGQVDEGRVFLYEGSASGLTTTPTWAAEGNEVAAHFGYSVDAAGDIDGDGWDDVIIGAPDYGSNDEGAAYVYHGSASGLSSTADWEVLGMESGGKLGSAVSGAGSVNGDAYGDVIVSAPLEDNGQVDEGVVYVYHGTSSGLELAPAQLLEIHSTGAHLGDGSRGIDSAGDLNGDGYDDVIVGAGHYGNSNYGLVAVWYGSSSGLPSSLDWSYIHGQSWSILGNSVAGAGDMDGDGYDDVVVGQSFYDEGFQDEGRIHVFRGSATGLQAGPAQWTAYGGKISARFGESVSGAGDINGDGYDDIVVGANNYKNALGDTYAGAGFVFLGKDQTVPDPVGTVLPRAWSVEGEQANARLGTSVSGGGDVNGDGWDDVILGEPDYTGDKVDEGRAFVYHSAMVSAWNLMVDGLGLDPSIVWVPWHQATPPDEVNGVLGTASEIAAAQEYSCAIQAETGNVVCWGWNYYGQTMPPDSVNGVSGTASELATGDLNSCAIQEGTGNVVCWGYDSTGTNNPPDSVNGVSGTATAVAVGRAYACAIQAGSGIVVCWGSGTAESMTPPDDVNGVSGTASAITVGNPFYPGHSCAIQAGTGNVVCWGSNTYGQSTPPDAVNGVSGTATSIAAGNFHTCAIQAGTGNVVCWGGLYSGTDTPPDTVNGTSGTAAVIAASYEHSCAIQAGTGNVICWGVDWYGKATPPDSVNGVSGTATAIAASIYHTCAIQSVTNAAICWGKGSTPYEQWYVSGPADDQRPNSETPGAVHYGPYPGSVVVSNGLASDLGLGDTDWFDDGLAESTSFRPSLRIPTWAKTLRFTTQLISREPQEGRPCDPVTISMEFWNYRAETPSWNVSDVASANASFCSGPVNSAVSHVFNVAEGNSHDWLTLGLRVSDEDGRFDTALIVSNMYFSENPLPSDIADCVGPPPEPGCPGVDDDGDGIADYYGNPSPQDVSLSAGTFAYNYDLLSVPGKGIPFSFSIFYNSAGIREEALSRKWTHSYETYAQELTGGDVIVRHGNGLSEYFETDGIGGYKPKFPGTFSTLSGSAGAFTYVTRSRLTHEFNVPHPSLSDVTMLGSITDPRGNDVILQYDTEGKIDYVQDTRGEIFTFGYEPHPEGGTRLVSVQYPEPGANWATVLLEYHSQTHDLKLVTDVNGLPTGFTYDETGNLRTITDADGVTRTHNDYESYQGLDINQIGDRVVTRRNGNLGDSGTSITYERESMEATDRTGAGKEISKFDVKGRLFARELLLGSDGFGNPCSEGTPSCWAYSSFEYDVDDNLIEQTDPLGVVSGFDYDDHGNRIRETQDLGGSDEATVYINYDTVFHLYPIERLIEKRGQTCNPAAPTSNECYIHGFVYDGFGYGELEQAIDPLGHVTSYNYTSDGQLESVTDARCNADLLCTTPTHLYSYDALANVESIVDAYGFGPTYVSDAMGRRASVTDALGNTTLLEYDTGGRLITETDALTHQTHHTYDAQGRRLTTTEANGAVWTNVYSGTGVLERTKDPLGHENIFSYDEEDLLALEIDPLGRYTSYAYDAAGRMIDVTDAENGTVSATYDAVGNRTSVTNPMDHTWTFVFDGLGRVVREIDPEGNETETTFDERGLLDSTTNGRDQLVDYQYDDAGRPTKVVLPLGGEFVHAHDENGKAGSSVFSGPGERFASVTNRSFDRLDRLTARTGELAPGVSKTIGNEYDAAGNLQKLIYSDLKEVLYGYDELNRLETVTDWDGNVTRYFYDEVGNLVRTELPDTTEVVVTYDDARRVTAISDGPAGGPVVYSASFTLNAAGRITGSNETLPLDPFVADSAETFVYDDADRLVSGGAGAYQYDADGNLVSGTIGGVTLNPGEIVHNELNQLEQLGTTTFRYDADGHRSAKTDGGGTTLYVQDASGGRSRLLEELDASGNVVARYVYGLGLISRQKGGSHSVYHYDSRGSTIALRSGGAITHRYAYGPYGELTGSQEADANPFRYAGKEGVVDDGNGLYYMRSRYYAPVLMRFIERDEAFAGTLTRTQSLNRYAYVEGNPIQFTDPDGDCPMCAGAAFGLVFQLGMDYADDGEINGPWEDYVLAGVGGAIGGGVAAKLMGKIGSVSKLGKLFSKTPWSRTTSFLTGGASTGIRGVLGNLAFRAPISFPVAFASKWGLDWRRDHERDLQVVRDVASAAADAAVDAVESVAEDVSDTASDAWDSVTDTAGDVYDAGSTAVRSVGSGARKAYRAISNWF